MQATFPARQGLEVMFLAAQQKQLLSSNRNSRTCSGPLVFRRCRPVTAKKTGALHVHVHGMLHLRSVDNVPFCCTCNLCVSEMVAGGVEVSVIDSTSGQDRYQVVTSILVSTDDPGSDTIGHFW